MFSLHPIIIEIISKYPLKQYAGQATVQSRLGLSNRNTIGIEFVGNYKTVINGTYPKDIDVPKGARVSWDQPSQKQIISGVRLIKYLMQKYNLNTENIYWHDDVSPKTGGEGEDVYNILIPLLK